jgi:putative integral membrane protein (TIGR02587 family)
MEDERQSPWSDEFDDLMRAVAGAFLFGVPFLYTMEVWWKGNFTAPPRMLLTLGIAYVALVLLDLGGGFRAQQPHTWARIFTDSLEALAVALVCAALSLLLIGVIDLNTSIEANLGRIVMEALPFSIGVGIANNIMQRGDGAKNEDADEDDDQADSSENMAAHQWHNHAWYGTLADAGATALGAVIVAFAIAPTDEIPLVSSTLSTPRLLAYIAVSLVLSYIIVFEAEFAAQTKRRTQPGIFQSPLSETLASYLISLVISLSMLWVFQLLRLEDPLSLWVSYTIVLGLPATIGGAAGRLAV